MTDPTDYKLWLEILLGVWNVMLTIALWLRKPGVDAGQAVAMLEKKHQEELGKVTNELGILTERMKHMPTDDEIGELKAEVRGIVSKLEVMPIMQRQLNRIEDHLLNSKSP